MASSMRSLLPLSLSPPPPSPLTPHLLPQFHPNKMKFMKLGSKPDAFQSDHESNSIRCVSSELETDFTVIVDEVKFYLHKFPLLSKSNRLQKLAISASDENSDVVHLADFPGGPKAFEICAKFCYGITVSLSPYNVVAARCAAEYLEMTEDIDSGNLIFKIEVFLKSSLLRSWKDSIIVLKTITALQQWSEDVEITSRCIESIASKTGIDRSRVTWSYSYNRKLDLTNKVAEIGCVPKDWWAEDLCELEIGVYKRVMLAVISKGQVEGDVIGEALSTYCAWWLPDCNDRFESDDDLVEKYKSLVESMICLLSIEKGVDCSCRFLLKLLKVSILVGVDSVTRDDLIRNVSLKLDEACVHDLLIPAQHPQITVYDVELVKLLVDRFFNPKSDDLVLVNPRRCTIVGRLIDAYLAEVAGDRNLTLCDFTALSRSIPDSGRPVHDVLYGAVDVYLKEHQSLTKEEKKKLCELIDVKKLTSKACTHAAQNDRLPLRMVVQILFHEQGRVTAAVKLSGVSNKTREQDWEEIKVPLRSKSLRTPSRVKMDDGDLEKEVVSGGVRQMGSRSRRMFDRFWVGSGRSKSTVTSGSSQTKSSGSSARKQRFSIS